MNAIAQQQKLIFAAMLITATLISSAVRAAAPAMMLTPANGTSLSATTVQLTWEDVGAMGYGLNIGTSRGASNLYAASHGTDTSAAINNLPNNGSTLYVRLWSLLSGSWQYNDYTYTAVYEGTVSPSSMISPTVGSTFNATTVQFSWENVGAASYGLFIGTSLGAQNLYAVDHGTNTSAIINNLPNDGSTLYVRLWSHIAGSWRYNDYTYTAANEETIEPSGMTSPADRSTFNATVVTFNWENIGAASYAILIGTSPGASDLYGADHGPITSVSIDGLPANGSTLYVRLASYLSGSWRYNDYIYTAFTEEAIKPSTMSSPADHATFSATSVTFNWENVGAANYGLYIGTSQGASDLYGAILDTNTTVTIDGLPDDGSTLHVRLWSDISGGWQYNDYLYTAYTRETATETAAITSPPNGSMFSATTVSFNWEDAGATAYYLYIGTSQGANDLYSAAQGTALSAIIDGLPSDGSRVHVRLWSSISGEWYYRDYSYTAASASCADTGDDDNDRLLNCFETNTGRYIDAFDTGTNPNLPDTDGDAISDGDEVLGTSAGLNLAAMGTNPLQKNILLEYDWFDDQLDCGQHSHRPSSAQIASISAAFANANHINPDGTTGIVLIHDYGQGGAFTGGNLLYDDNGVLLSGVSGGEFLAYKASNFAANRNGYFHYVILPHHYNVESNSSGQAELTGDDLIVSLQCSLSTSNVANTIMHELGHNLSLRHGGNENCNYKPNYNSVMNYKYQFPGVDNDCDAQPNGVLSFSYGTNISLVENSLNETLGVCGGGARPIDWNQSGSLQSQVIIDLNSGDAFQSIACGGALTTLHDYDDWGNISFHGIGGPNDVNSAANRDIEIIDCSANSVPR
jgi:hypothetical protein